MRRYIPDFEELEEKLELKSKFNKIIGIITLIGILLVLLPVKETRILAMITIIATLFITVILKAKDSKKTKKLEHLPDREIRYYRCDQLEKKTNYDSDLASDAYYYYVWLGGKRYSIDSLDYNISRVGDVFITLYNNGHLIALHNAREWTVSDSMKKYVTQGQEELERFENALSHELSEQYAKEQSEKDYWNEIDRIERKFNIGSITEEEKALKILKAENKKKYYHELSELKAQLKSKEITDEDYKRLCDQYVLEGAYKQ